MTEVAFTHADLLAAEKQQLRLLIEQQQQQLSTAQSQHGPSSYASYAPPFPIISLADDWQLNSSPLPPPIASASASASASATVPDDMFDYLHDDASASGTGANAKLFHPASFSHSYSVTSDYYSTQPSALPASPSSYHDGSSSKQIASYDQPCAAASHKRSHRDTAEPDDLPPTKRLTVELPASSLQLLKKVAGQQSVALQAQYPLLSSELVDGFFATNVNVGSGVMGGLDDSELGLATAASRQASELSLFNESRGTAEQLVKHEPLDTLPAVGDASPLPMLSLEPQTSQLSQVSLSSSTAPSVPFMPSSLSSVLSSLSSSASSPLDNPSSLSNLTNRLLSPDMRCEGQRRMKRRLTDKQRRAKIKDGLEHLRSLVALHGNSSSDQASIVNSSVDLVQQLVDEREDLKHELRKANDERQEIEREQHDAFEKQRLAAAVLPSSIPAAAADKPAQADLSVLLHHLSNILTPVLGTGGRPETEPNTAAGGAAGGLEHLVLSQYFLHTLKLLTNLPRNNHA